MNQDHLITLKVHNLIHEENMLEPTHLVGQVDEAGDDEWEIVSSDEEIDENIECTNVVSRSDSNSSSTSPWMEMKGANFFEHVVLPTDTLQGICISYKISATKIRQINNFSGSSLNLAPAKLIIPIDQNDVESGKVRIQDKNTREFKVQAILMKIHGINLDEAKGYLDVANGDLDMAVRTAQDDKEWDIEQEHDRNENIQDHEISIKSSFVKRNASSAMGVSVIPKQFYNPRVSRKK